MIRLRLLRRLATAAKLNPSKPLLCRNNPHNALNLDPIQVSKDVDLDYKRYRMTNYDTKIRVNNFLQAVFSNDMMRSFQLLAKFREKCSLNRHSDAYFRNVEVYVSCLSTLLAYASNKDTAATSFRNNLMLLTEIFRIPAHVSNERLAEVRNILMMLVSVLLKTLQLVPITQKRTLAILRAQIKEFASTHGFGGEEIFENIKIKNPELVDLYNYVWKMNHSLEEVGDNPSISIELYLNPDQSMSFVGLCNFLEKELFDASSFTHRTGAKYYELYEQLESEERARFMDEYLCFNKQKQILVEKYCQDLQPPPLKRNPQHDQLRQALALPWIMEIHKRICLELDHLLSGKAVDSELSKVFLPHSFLIEQVSKEVISSIMLTTLLRKLLHENSLAGVLQLTKEMSSLLRFHIKRNRTLAPLSNRTSGFLSEEDSIALFAALLKLAILNSKVGSFGLLETYAAEHEYFSKHPLVLFAFKHELPKDDTPNYKRAGIIMAHPFLLRNSALFDELLQGGASLFPMVHPPKPWTSPQSGGFLSDIAPLVRSLEPAIINKYLTQAHLTGQLNSTFDSLNALGELLWAVNSDMEELFGELMSIPEGFMNIPPTSETIAKMAKPKLPKKDQFANSEDYSAAQNEFQLSLKKHNEIVLNLRSRRSYYDMNARIANALSKNGEMFFYTHTLDFRGRVYPAVSVLSYQAEDLIRSLLVFWVAKPLGRKGFDWLKYQLANLFSNHYMTMEELLEFVERNRANVEKSAQSSLDELWWTKGDTPWQVLAHCKEIYRIWNYEGRIEDYLCRIPIHMDGTCNGLQHYAALGANVEAAKSVNLLPNSRKNDIYLTVLSLVEQEVKKECESQNYSISSLAQEAQGYLSRKVVKRTVMTTVYGVTLFGAYRQIKETLPLVSMDGSPISSGRLTEILLYLARHVLQAVGNLFREARAIQNFLKENTFRCISAVDKSILKHTKNIDFFRNLYKPMMWTSLSGFPVIQNYRRKDIKEVRTVLQSVTTRRSTSKSPIDSRKQIAGIAPNFIHSLDAIHLLMSNLAAKHNRIAFAAVHDSFWTHPCDVDVLNRLIRQEFVRLHSSDILLNFYEDLKHVNRDAYQLVWVENKTNPEFVGEINKLRGQRKNLKKKDWLNMCLNEEFKSADQAEKIRCLVERYDPQLILKTKHNGDGVIYDSRNSVRPCESLVSFFTHTPLLVKIQLSPVPDVGDLDIREVLNSQYFFS